MENKNEEYNKGFDAGYVMGLRRAADELGLLITDYESGRIIVLGLRNHLREFADKTERDILKKETELLDKKVK